MKTRRDFLCFSGFIALGVATRRASAAIDVVERVLIAESAIAKRIATTNAVSAEFVLASLGADMGPVETRIAIFELVRRVPYKLTSWTGDPMSLFSLQRGDCRHKATAANQLLRKSSFRSDHRVVTFDWADLPIPPEILALLTDTRSFHDTVYVNIDGRQVLFDATWDPALGLAGFPVTNAWDGNTSTAAITQGKTQIVRQNDIPKGSNMYEHFGVKWPNREKTLAFNRSFNAWSDGVRARGPGITAAAR